MSEKITVTVGDDRDPFKFRFQEAKDEIRANKGNDNWNRTTIRRPKFVKTAIRDVSDEFGNCGVVTAISTALRYGFNEYEYRFDDDLIELNNSLKNLRKIQSNVTDSFQDQKLELNHTKETVDGNININIESNMDGRLTEYSSVLNIGPSELKRHLIAVAISHAEDASVIPETEWANLYERELMDWTRERLRTIEALTDAFEEEIEIGSRTDQERREILLEDAFRLVDEVYENGIPENTIVNLGTDCGGLTEQEVTETLDDLVDRHEVIIPQPGHYSLAD